MPLIETLTLLASLGSALQTLRTGRAVEEQNEGKDAGSTGLLLSYEHVKTSQDATMRADDSVTGRLQLLLLVSGAVVAAVCAVGAGFADDADAGSPLFIAALILFGVVALAAAFAVVARLESVAVEGVIARQSVLGDLDFLREMLAQGVRLERSNRRLIASKSTALGVACLCFAAQVVLLAVWVLEA